MFKKGIIFIFLMIVPYSFSQNTLCVGDDGTFCVGTSITIENCGNASGGLDVGLLLDNPTYVSLTDDKFSGVIPMGFVFNFYGIDYNKCLIGSNGMISFDLSKANGYNGWSLNGNPLPSTGAPGDARNAAMLCYHDINPNQGGVIAYQSMGTAPNRQFVVVYSNIPMFSTAECNYMAVVFYETSNIIEYYISFKPTSPTWNSSLAIQGVQNASGTVAHTTPGRNNTVWSASNDAVRYQPTAPNNTTAYTISNIPFFPILESNASFEWKDTDGNTYPYNNGNLVINSVVPGTRGYFMSVAGASCNSQVGAVSDTSFITGVSSSVTATVIDDICSAGIGSVSATPISGQSPYTYNWPALGSTDQVVNGVSAGTYVVNMTDGMGCSSSATVVVGDTPATYPTSSTLVSCPGGNDGTATVSMVPELGNVTYQWNDPNQQTTSQAVGLSAGTYECVVSSDVGCQNTITVVVDEIPGMQVQWTNVQDVTCNSGSDGQATAVVTQGTQPYFYSWSNSDSDTQTADNLAFGTHTLTITDVNGCIVNEDIQINQPQALFVDMISADTIVCIGDTAVLKAQGGGGSSDYIYEWYENGIFLGNTQNITVEPTFENVEYTLILKEVCGSPSATDYTTVSWPPEVQVMVLPDTTGGCHPVEITFENTTSTTDPIDYTVWRFSDGGIDTVQNAAPIKHTFGLGPWDVSMEVVTTRGCVYNQNFPYLVEGYPIPEPNFYGNPSPVTMIDPVVQLYSQSSSDAANYTWNMEGGTPNYSTAKDPIVKYPTNIVDDYPVTLIVENEFHCVDSITRIISVVNEVLFFAPNSFTPDGDGFNENWRVHVSGIDIYNFNLQVFNRWGEIVFESNDANSTWDGTYGSKRLPEGTYIWRATATDYHNDNKYEFDGHVTILR
ncbi:MAG: gliding motility-associated C-terminal domain-containing protein [Brumimicrobium sp.]